jgi:hypothetical protein
MSGHTADQADQSPFYYTLPREVQGPKQDYTLPTYYFLAKWHIQKDGDPYIPVSSIKLTCLV